MNGAIKSRWFYRKSNDLANTPYHLSGENGENFLTEGQAREALKREAKRLKMGPKGLEGPFQFAGSVR